MTRSPNTLRVGDAWLIGCVFGTAAVLAVLWAGAALSAISSGYAVPSKHLTAAVSVVLNHRNDPSAGWRQPVGPPTVYWSCTLFVLVLLLALGALCWWVVVRHRQANQADPRRLPGLAARRDVTKLAGRAALMSRASILRPSLRRPRVVDVGHPLGHSRGVTCYASCEDSLVLLGPPRSGKGLHVVINAILDAPGAVVTTSTRPDNLVATLAACKASGPVAVFDPQRLAPGIPSATRWSPIRGCENPQMALVRARALTSDAAKGISEANFWQSSAEQAVRCLLHAAALGNRTSEDLYRWSLSAIAAREAVMVLATHPRAAAGWRQGLEAITSADIKQRDSVWAMVGIAFAALADPHVLDAVSPGPDEQFDPEDFLRRRGTVYLVGTSTGAAATAGLVGAFVEDIAEAARRIAARSPGARLDPPLAMILDEAANYPLPSLPSLMSEGGGTGIATLVVLQSLAQARAVWGEHHAGAIWDAAIVKLILGGGSNARDLDDLSRLIGTRTEDQRSRSVNADGATSHSTSPHEVPVMDSSRLRMLPFGTGILLLRAAKPIILTLTPWTQRRDAARLQQDRERLEEQIRDAHSAHGLPCSQAVCRPSSHMEPDGEHVTGADR